MFGQALQRSCMAMCVFCSTLLNFVFAGRLGINTMDLGLMCVSLWAEEEATIEEEENDDGVCGHRPGDISECGNTYFTCWRLS